MSKEWQESVSKLYLNEDSTINIYHLAYERLNILVLFIIIVVVTIPGGMQRAADIANALSVQKLTEEGIQVRNVGALEAIGSLDRCIIDFTRGFTHIYI